MVPSMKNLVSILTLFVICLMPQSLIGSQVEDGYEEIDSPKRYFPFSGRPKKNTPAGQLDYAHMLADKKKVGKAIRQYRALVLRWPALTEAGIAQYELAKLLEKKKRYHQATEAYEYLLEHYAGMIPYNEVLNRLFAMGEKLAQERKGTFLIFKGISAPERAIPIFELIVRYAPEWEQSAEIQYRIGRIQQKNHEYELAIDAYTDVQFRHPSSTWTEDASMYKAECLYLLSEESPQNQDKAEDVWVELTLFLTNYPDSGYQELAYKYKEKIRKRRAKLAYEKAYFYDTIQSRPEAALRAYTSFVEEFPHSEWTDVAQLRIHALSDSVKGSHSKQD